ncbi:MAG: hypothetical protein KHX73_08470 [Clostridium sp.]|uniref:hypothetical protein n=1 Tax=uncultured Clostridium sp. TaxID=59620 RepID=UPI0015E72901|nr:hypothetical protein [Clostridium sp.]
MLSAFHAAAAIPRPLWSAPESDQLYKFSYYTFLLSWFPKNNFMSKILRQQLEYLRDILPPLS